MVLSLDTNGRRSRLGKSSTTLLSPEILEIIRQLGIRALINCWRRCGLKQLEGKIDRIGVYIFI